MKNYIITFTLVSILLLSCFVITPVSRGINKGDTENILYVGGTGPGNYSNIQEAIDNANDGDIIYVYNGTYYENLRISKKINLIGEDKENTIIDCLHRTIICISLLADSVTISGFTIKNGNTGIWMYHGTNNTISNNVITNQRDEGVVLCSMSKKPIKGNKIIGNEIINNSGYGIVIVASSSEILVKDNIISYNKKHGIMLVDSSNNNITGNTISRNEFHGIYVKCYFKNNIIIHNNIIENNKSGIYLKGGHNNIIKENIIVKNKQNGIFLIQHGNNSKYNTIVNNTVIENNWGINLSYSILNNISRNNISNNQQNGISISHGGGNWLLGNHVENNKGIGVFIERANSNKIINNYLKNNTRNSFFKVALRSRNNNLWLRNYWDRPRLLPYPIIGTKEEGDKIIKQVKFDWRPRIIPILNII